MDFFCKIINGLILPVNDSDYEALHRLKSTSIYKITVVEPRNYEFHKKFFALMNLMYQNQDDFNNFEHFRDWVTIKAGFYKAYQTEKGIFYSPDSISYSAKDNIQFEEVYNRVLDFACNFLDTKKETILNELKSFL